MPNGADLQRATRFKTKPDEFFIVPAAIADEALASPRHVDHGIDDDVFRNVVAESRYLAGFLPFSGYHVGQRFLDKPPFGAKLTVQAAVGHAGRFGQRINACPGDTVVRRKNTVRRRWR